MKRLPQEHCVIISREVGVESWDLDKMMSIVGKEVEARERTCASIGTNCCSFACHKSSTEMLLM